MIFKINNFHIKYKIKVIRFREHRLKIPRYQISFISFKKVKNTWIHFEARVVKKENDLFLKIWEPKQKPVVDSVDVLGENCFYNISHFKLNTFDSIRYRIVLGLKSIQLFLRQKWAYTTKIKKNLYGFLFASIISIIFGYVEYNFNNVISNTIDNNIILKSFIFFLTLSSVINIFLPFTFREEVNIDDVEWLIDHKIKISEISQKQKDDKRPY